MNQQILDKQQEALGLNAGEQPSVITATKSVIALAQQAVIDQASSDLFSPDGPKNHTIHTNGLRVQAKTIYADPVDDAAPVGMFNSQVFSDFDTISKEIETLAKVSVSPVYKRMIGSVVAELQDSEKSFKATGMLELSPVAGRIFGTFINGVSSFADADSISLTSVPMDLSINPISNTGGTTGISDFTVSNKNGSGYLPGQLIETLYPYTISYFLERDFLHPCPFRDKLLTTIYDTSGSNLMASNHIDTIIELLGTEAIVSDGRANPSNYLAFEARGEKVRDMAVSNVTKHVRTLAITAEQYANDVLRAVYIKSLIGGINALLTAAEDEHSNKLSQMIPTEVVANGQFGGEGQIKLSGIDTDGLPNQTLYIGDLRMVLEVSRHHYAGFNCSVITVHPMAMLIFDSFHVIDQGFLPQKTWGHGSDVLGDKSWNNTPINNSSMSDFDPYIHALGGTGTTAFGRKPSETELNGGRFNVIPTSRNRSLLQMSANLWEKHVMLVGSHTIELMPDRTHKIYDSLTNYSDVTAKVITSSSMLVLGEDLSTDLYLYDHTRVGILITSGVRQLTKDVTEWDQNATLKLTAFELVDKAYLYTNALRLKIEKVKIGSARNKDFVNVRMVTTPTT